MKYKTTKQEGETKRNRSTMSEGMITLLVEQVGHELHNHNLYKSFANYFGSEGLHLLEKYYNMRADEELLHHNWIVKHLSDRDVVFNYPAVPEVKEITGHMEILRETCIVEEDTTNLIYAIADLAKEENDWLTLAWLMGNSETDGKLLMEQLEEEAISNLVYDIASQDGSWLEKERVIMSAYANNN